MLRQDRSALARPTRTADAHIFEGHAARAHAPGDPLWYESGPEHRDIAEVRRIVDQLPGTPITLGHGGRVVGAVVGAWLDGEHAAARMRISDGAAIEAIRARTRELSIGYGCDVVDGYQVGIKLHELSLVEAARCGSSCAINTDSKRSDCAGTCTCSAPKKKDNSMLAQLKLAAQRLGLRTDAIGHDERALALAILVAIGDGHDPAGPCSPDNSERIDSRDHAYITGRALEAARFRAERAVRADAAKRYATVTEHVDAGEDLGDLARQKMIRENRLAWSRNTPRADEAEAAVAIKERVAARYGNAGLARPEPPRHDGDAPDEATARAAMLAEHANAWRTPIVDGEES